MSLRELEDVNVDTTVQEKAITFPTGAKLYHKMRDLLVSATPNDARALLSHFIFSENNNPN